MGVEALDMLDMLDRVDDDSMLKVSWVVDKYLALGRLVRCELSDARQATPLLCTWISRPLIFIETGCSALRGSIIRFSVRMQWMMTCAQGFLVC